MSNKYIIIIPARAGSKGIPKKNVRPMAGKPLISYSIELALKVPNATVILTTDDQELITIGNSFTGLLIRERPLELCNDSVPLDPVILDAAEWAKEQNISYESIITLQPTSPTLTLESINKALNIFESKDCKTLITAKEDIHLRWEQKNNQFTPLYSERVNRQLLPKEYKETGAYVICEKEQLLKNKTRISSSIELCVLPEKESIDIDTQFDWVLAEHILQKKKIYYYLVGSKKLGLGHAYNACELAYQLTDFEFHFFTDSTQDLAVDFLKNRFFDVTTVNDKSDFINKCQIDQPRLVINDILDTDAEYMKELSSLKSKVVNFEDLGPGHSLADLTINALYKENNDDPKNLLSGPKFFLIREQFKHTTPRPIESEIKNILLSFGGVDPSNNTQKVLDYLSKPNKKYNITVILGRGYQHDLKLNGDIKVLHNVTNMATLMNSADLIFTSAGRTIYEVAAIGVPTIVLAQNQRELLHYFANEKYGFINLGLGSNVTDQSLNQAIDKISNQKFRIENRQKMLANEIINGPQNISKSIRNLLT